MMGKNHLYETVFNEILHEVHIWQLVRDSEGNIKTWRLIDANPSALKTWGKTLAEVKGMTTDELFPGVNATKTFMPIVEKIFREKKPHSWESYFEGTDQTLQMTSIPLDDVFISTGVDVSTIRRSERDLIASQQRLAIATGSAHIGIWEYDLKSQMLIWDTSMYDIYGVSPSTDELPLTTWHHGVHKDDADKAFLDLETSIRNETNFKSEFRIICNKTGEVKHILADAVFKKGDENESDKMIGVNIDISDRKIAEQKIETLAYFDTLTGLPNRSMIDDRLTQCIALSERTQYYNALIFVDLDNFKRINDTLGHALGDELLIAFSKRIQREVRKIDTFGKFGGDEFIIILTNLDKSISKSIQHSDQFSKKIANLCREPFILSTGTHNISASFGISLFKCEYSPSEILRQADLAMYKAKGSGRNCIHFYDSEMQQLFLERIDIENDLSEAISKDQIEIHYQIQMTDTGKARGVEALARWNHPERGYIPPSKFISIAEDTGKIAELGSWIFRKACSDLKNHIHEYVGIDFTVSINVSALQIFDNDFIETIQGHIITTGVHPSQIRIELTESAVIHEFEEINKKIIALKELGFKFSLDDFGTGHSSLINLKRLPIDELKIDQSFIKDIPSDSNSLAIAKSVIVLADSMGLDVIAEGVEEKHQKAALLEMGCTCFQGYFFSKPLPLGKLIPLLKGI